MLEKIKIILGLSLTIFLLCLSYSVIVWINSNGLRTSLQERDMVLRESVYTQNLKNEGLLADCLTKLDKGSNDYRQQDQDLCFKQYPIR